MKLQSLRLLQNAELLPLLIGSLILTAVLAAAFYLLYRKKKNPDLLYSFLLTLTIALYSLVSFMRLGSMKMPSTTWQPGSCPQEIILELTGPTQFSEILVFYGEGDNNSNWSDYQLGTNDIITEGSDDLEHWDELAILKEGSIYRYAPYYGYWDYHYIRLTSVNSNDTISEIAFYGEDGGKPLPVRVHADSMADTAYPASLIVDEQDLIPEDITFFDESYFDEIYHPRNAWEIANGQYMYPTVHPLLGTECIALSILLFGNNPFAWRLPGALFGVGLLLMLHHILLLLSEDRRTAVYGTMLAACDFMHITTSRIATLEPMSVFSILAMFDLMIQYAKTSFYAVPFRKTLMILLGCGTVMGLAIAVKWTACYSAVGLAAILFYTLYQRWREWRMWMKCEKPCENERTLRRFPEYFIKTILSCFVFFIAIPIAIYLLAYLPAHISRHGYSVQTVIDYTLGIYRYHVNLTATHPFESVWYQWLLDIRPIWYYSGTGMDGTYYTISCFSNPLLCLAGIPAILYIIYLAIKEQRKNALFVAIGYLTAIVPWVLVTRCVFAYHFYPTSMFMIMAIALCYQVLVNKHPKLRPFFAVFLVLVLIVFIVYLPITCGFGTTRQYAQALEVLPSWTFQ